MADMWLNSLRLSPLAWVGANSRLHAAFPKPPGQRFREKITQQQFQSTYLGTALPSGWFLNNLFRGHQKP